MDMITKMQQQGGESARPAASGPQVVIGSKNAFPNMPSTSQRYFFTDADADINTNKSGSPAEHAAQPGGHFAYGGANRAGTQVRRVVHD
jgi:hypothetical protein